MKTLVILFASDDSDELFIKRFDSLCAFDISLMWAKRFPDSGIVVFTSQKYEEKIKSLGIDTVFSSEWTNSTLLLKMKEAALKADAEEIIYSWADLPFINYELTEELLEVHRKYGAEYTFADGYPYGLAPEVIASSTVAILSNLTSSSYKIEAEKQVCRESIFNLLKTDLNSFEIETVLADEDWRLFRISLDTGRLQNSLACQALFKCGVENKTAGEISEIAAKNVNVLKTVPSYYEIQLSAKNNVKSIYLPDEFNLKSETFMDKDDFKRLIKSIKDFSNKAVISLSLAGEPLLHPYFEECAKTVLEYDGFSLLVETDGFFVNESLCQNLLDACRGRSFADGIEKIIWLVRLDAFTSQTYSSVHETSDGFFKACNAVNILNRFFSGSVYPQFVRMNKNEDELESFYRFWSAPDSPSGGNVLVQKYENFCKTLPDEKPADLSPLERNPCWHIRRDFYVYADGSVPFCRQCVKSKIIGNVFKEPIEKIWERLTESVQNHINGEYPECCKKCDEYYVFNF